MRALIREILGGFFVFLGLFAFLICLDFLYARRLIEGVITFFFGLAVFKAGIHLLKVGLAAHILINETRRQNEARRPARTEGTGR